MYAHCMFARRLIAELVSSMLASLPHSVALRRGAYVYRFVLMLLHVPDEDRRQVRVDVGLDDSDGELEREEYVLTDAGRALLPVLAAMSAWGDEYRPSGFGPAALYADRESGTPRRSAFVPSYPD